MALTAAEKQKAYRDRKIAEQRAARDATHPYLKRTFSEYAEQHAGFTDFELPLWTAGIEAPTFFDERGPEHFVIQDATQGLEDPFGHAQGAIGRAEVIINCLIDAAIELGVAVNSYKRREIETRLAELARSEPADADRETTIQEAVKLNKILDQLDKQVRRSFPQWKVTGV